MEPCFWAAEGAYIAQAVREYKDGLFTFIFGSDEVKHYERVYRDAHREGRAEGMAEGMAEGIVNMIQAFKFSFEQAASIMGIPDEEFPLYKKLIAELLQSSDRSAYGTK